jgi:HSP20 family protein
MTMGPIVPFGRGGPMLPGRMINDDPFVRLWSDIDRLFSNVMQGTGSTGWQPAGAVGLPVEVYEEGNELRVVAELPGVEEKDVAVELTGNVLTIKGEKKVEQERDGEGYHLAERRYGTFSRSLQLPYEVKADEVQASFRNGVLTVTMPKPAERQPKRIEVKKAA